MFSSDEHSAKALLPIFVTLSGIIISVSPLKPENAYSPISVTPSGIVISVISLIFSKANVRAALGLAAFRAALCACARIGCTALAVRASRA